MKSFTAKEFSRCPAKVYEAAREDGKVEVTHDRFMGRFFVHYDSNPSLYESIPEARKQLIDAGLIPLYQLTEKEISYLKNKKATD